MSKDEDSCDGRDRGVEIWSSIGFAVLMTLLTVLFEPMYKDPQPRDLTQFTVSFATTLFGVIVGLVAGRLRILNLPKAPRVALLLTGAFLLALMMVFVSDLLEQWIGGRSRDSLVIFGVLCGMLSGRCSQNEPSGEAV
ncbi:MAG TPA: hypothetical protein VEX38_06715 [Fimbriimonadaceae bacterium]|nr:hypothetical protein [Fimbriimonadaceae bacterium]